MDLSAELGYWPSPSQEAVAKSWCEADLLTTEEQVRWLDPHAHHLPWLREKFLDPLPPRRRPRGREVRAVTSEKRGRTVRVFTARVDDLAAYGQLLAQHRGTCPMEAVDPLTIEPGQPATPAHLKLLASIGARLAPRGITPP